MQYTSQVGQATCNNLITYYLNINIGIIIYYIEFIIIPNIIISRFRQNALFQDFTWLEQISGGIPADQPRTADNALFKNNKNGK